MEKLGITKEQFIEVMVAIYKQDLHDQKCVDAFEVILTEDRVVIGYDNSHLRMALLKLLEIVCFDTENKWIEYFIYELDFGEKYKKGCVTSNGKNCDISTTGKLYNFLEKNIND